MAARGKRIVEVPINYSPRSREEGKKIGMRDWFGTQRNASASTAGYIATMSKAAGRDLTPWFDKAEIFGSEPAANEKLDPNALF